MTTQTGTCARNLPQHFNGCTCTPAPGGLTAEVVDVDLASVRLADDTRYQYPDGSPRAYALLDEPEETVLYDGTTVVNYMAEPSADEEAIFAYATIASDRPNRFVKDDLPGIPGKAHHFSGDVGARDGARLMRVSGHARSHAEAWDRAGAAKGPWADKYDLRPSTLKVTADLQARGRLAQDDEARARRLGAADELTEAIAERKALRGPAIFGRRRKVVEVNARIDAAWAAYQEAYPNAKPQDNR
jgi:hypothetical protein